MKKYNSRSEVPDKYKWNLNDFFNENSDLKDAIKELNKRLDKYDKYHGCTKDSKKLLEFLEYDEKLLSEMMDVICYAYTKNDEDLGISKNEENLHLASTLESNYALKSSFFSPELLSLSKEKYQQLFKDKKLKKYQAYLDDIYRYKDHELKKEEKEIVAMLTCTLPTFSNTSSQLLNNNHDYGKVNDEILTLTNYRKIMKKLPREKRKEVYLQLNKVLDQYSSTSASLLNNYVKTENALAKIHKFNNSWESYLFDQKLNQDVFDALVSGVHENKSIIKKYEKIKAQNLGVDEIMPWDSPLEFYESNKEYSIEEGNKLILKSLSILGDDYLDHFKNTINGGNIDYCGYKGKCSGGYNISSINQKNSKILMSFNYDLDSVSTIAHEGGHHVNHQYLCENNDKIYCSHSTLLAEIASLTNECLLSSYLSNSRDKDEALSGISNIVRVINSNLIGAVIEGNIEKKMYDYVNEGNSLTNEYLNKLVEDEIKDYYGLKSLKHDYQKLSWITRSHYFMHFYLYSYAICISVASYIAKEILNGNKKMHENYIKFLKIGSDKTIDEAFSVLDIDLKDKKIYVGAMEYLDSLLDKFIKIKDGE